MNAPIIKRPFDVEAVRAEFPILGRQVHGAPLVYLDNAASAQKPEAVIAAMAGAMRGAYANVHRGLHALANETTEAFEAARATAARLINAASPQSIVFTKGGTQAINIVAAGLDVKPGDEIVLSVMEHHSNIVPWHFLRERKGAVLKWLDVSEDGDVDLSALDALIGPRTKLVAITHMSNVLGAPTPAAEIARIAHAKGAPVLFDGCQAVVHGRVDVQAIDADFYAFTGHKLYGPTGIGVLYGAAAVRGRRRDDRHRRAGARHLQRAAASFRGRYAADPGGDWPQGGDRLVRGPGPRRHRGARSGAEGPHAGCAAFAQLGQAARPGGRQGGDHRLLGGGRASARRGADPGSTGCRGAGRTPLRAAPDAAVGGNRYGQGELCLL